jgi:hypothetical protein
MEFRRSKTCLLAIALAYFPLHADTNLSQQALERYCEQQLPGSATCRIQPCPCPPPFNTLARSGDTADATPLCACGSQIDSLQVYRQQAVSACDNYRLTTRQPCFISRGECPPGFEALQRYTNGADIRFTACRDRRNEMPVTESTHLAELRTGSAHPVMEQYQRLVTALEKGRQGSEHELPASTVEALSPYFRGLPLERLKFSHTKALSNGCFSDCDHIFCASAQTIADWTHPQEPMLTRLLLHQIAHAESCQREGGRERYVTHWLRYLSDEVQRKLLDGQPVDADQIHFAMYMERHAEIKANNLCLSIPGCRME